MVDWDLHREAFAEIWHQIWTACLVIGAVVSFFGFVGVVGAGVFFFPHVVLPVIGGAIIAAWYSCVYSEKKRIRKRRERSGGTRG